MLEEEFKADNPNIKNEKSESENQVDKFSQTTKLLDKELKDKKENISKVLEEGNLKEIFENLLSSEDGELCIMSLLECENNKEEIKKVIFANLPEGYTYNVSTNEVVKTEKKNANDYTGATTLDQKTEQADQKTEQADQKTEQADQKTEQANQKTEQADQKTEQADQKTERADQKTENLDSENRMKQAIEERDRLVAKYQEQNLDAKTNPGSEIYQTVKDQLENNGTLNQLRQNHDEQFINDYILVQTTLTELKSNPTNYEQSDISNFDKIVKNLNNACNIPDTNLSSFSTENIAQTRTELFNDEIGNDSLRQAKQSNLESRDYSEMLPEMGNEEMFKKYGQFLKGDLRKSWDEYKGNYLGFVEKINSINAKRSRGEDLVPEEQSLLSLESAIKGIKETIDNDTKNMAEELCLISQIKGMYMCMGESSNFNLNKSREIEMEDGILTLRGHIDGVDFAIRQDTNNPEARLQTSQKLARSIDGNTFSIGGKDKDNFVDSNFILPSQKEIFDSIKETVTSGESLANSDNPEDYIKNLQENIMGKMEDKYKDTEYVHHYMQGQVGGEKIIDNTLGLINNAKQNITDDETLMKGINQATNKDLFDFIKIIKFNIDNSTNAEKDNLNKCITKIIEITDNYKDTNGIEDFVSLKYPPVIENYLKDKAWLNGGNEDSRLKMLSDLFKFYSEKSRDTRSNSEGNNGGTSSKMIINDLYRDLFEFQGLGQSEIALTRKNENQEMQDKKNADKALDLENPDLRPEG